MASDYYKAPEKFDTRIRRIQKELGVASDGAVGNETLTALEDRLGLEPLGGSLKISKEALDLIIQFETGGKPYYDRFLKKPSWPGYSSGVTIGFGYDLGYNSKAAIQNDWKSELPQIVINELKEAAGITGKRAKGYTYDLDYITIPWETAERVFHRVTLQKFATLTVTKAFPGAEYLHPHALGALVSLVFNRGTSMSGDSRVEMKAIRDHIAEFNAGADYSYIADQVLSMRRLWPKKNGKTDLYGRRTAEAELLLRAGKTPEDIDGIVTI